MSEDRDTPVLDLLVRMTADSVEASSLDDKELMLVRLAALVATDAPTVSYFLNLGAAGDVDVEADDITGLLTAIAPIVGTSRVVSASENIMRAIGVAIDLAELESEATQQ